MTLRDTHEDENSSNTISSILAIYLAEGKDSKIRREFRIRKAKDSYRKENGFRNWKIEVL